MAKYGLVTGALSAMLAVLLGAFGAHALEAQLSPKALAVFDTANQYHMIHSLALICLGIVSMFSAKMSELSQRGLQTSAIAFSLGLTLFSGGLYIYSITSVTWLAMRAPVGGLAFIIGWLGFAVAALQLKNND